MSMWHRACAGFAARLPRRGIEDFWAGGIRDPKIQPSEAMRRAGLSGDPWPAVLLRLKSFEDLHKLWYVCLKEKNFLLGEQHAARQLRLRWKHHGRLKKCKLSMKRILTVLSRREIHQQALRSKEILEKQTQREELETQRFHLEEAIKVLRYKINREGPRDSMATAAWKATLKKYEADHAALLTEVGPLRKETMQLLTPDWRFGRRYSDLPGAVNWKKEARAGNFKISLQLNGADCNVINNLSADNWTQGGNYTVDCGGSKFQFEYISNWGLDEVVVNTSGAHDPVLQMGVGFVLAYWLHPKRAEEVAAQQAMNVLEQRVGGW